MVIAIKNNKNKAKHWKRLVFYSLMIAFPVAQFLLFYVFVNFNSIVLAFQKYDYGSGKYIFNGFESFNLVFSDFKNVDYLSKAVSNSLIFYLYSLLAGATLAVLFSYYIYKKFKGSEVFKVFLFMPSVISSVVLVIMFSYFSERAYPFFVEKIFNKQVDGLISNTNLVFGTILIYTILVSLGPQILMYSGAMNSISESVVESAKIDGVTPIKEFIHITLPMIWRTFTTFIVVGVAGIFINQMNLFSFFGTSAEYELYTVGYYLYRAMKLKATTLAQYPYYSAMGLVFTAVSIPLTFLVKFLLEKLGPKEV